jgi:ornithine cyclodeaminase/alanine dehydrogenase-like protein (mu-crystallin family)
VRILTESDVAACLGMGDALDIVRRALGEHARGRVDAPVRAEVRSPAQGMLGLFMPAHVPALEAFGQKTVAEFTANADRGLPVLTASLTLHDYRTGLLECIMGATYLTNVRSGALAAVAAAELAPTAEVATIMGTGGLAPGLVAGLAEALDLSEIRIWGRRPDQARRAVEEATALDLPGNVRLLAVDEAEDAVRGSEVVVTATSARDPVVADDWVSSGTLLCAMGSNAPHMRELPTDLMSRARSVVVDTRDGVIGRAGEIVTAMADGVLDEAGIRELGDVLVHGDGETIAADGVTVFKSCGFAALDVAIGAAVLRRADEQGLGQRADLGQRE